MENGQMREQKKKKNIECGHIFRCDNGEYRIEHAHSVQEQMC